MTLRKEREKFERELRQKVIGLIYDTQREIQMNTPVDTGRLRNSIKFEEKGNSFIIGTNVDYAPQVEEGTSPHEITPKNAQALKFKAGGETIFAKRVMHPGTEGHHMFLRGVNYFKKRLKGLKNQ